LIYNLFVYLKTWKHAQSSKKTFEYSTINSDCSSNWASY